jgi:catechol 2,3-dioxygenase-like lactoylglutathione lyase family enzyme
VPCLRTYPSTWAKQCWGTANELAAWEQRLKAEDIAIEGRTKWPRGGESIYFRDPEDGHLLELATPGLWPGY